MAAYWPSSFFCVFMGKDRVEVHKLAKKMKPISNELVIKRRSKRLSGKFFLQNTVGSRLLS